MLKLTQEEALKYQEKIDAFNTFNDIFYGVWSLSHTFFRKFTLKEILSENFYPDGYNTITKWFHGAGLNYLESVVLDKERREQYETLFSSFTEEEATTLASELATIAKERYLPGEYLPSLIELFRALLIKHKGSVENVIGYVFENGILNRVGSTTVTKYIDNFISKEKITDPVELIKVIQKNIPHYNNFPLIILNNNIDNETKIKALKLGYRQKDFPQYKIYLRNNIRDFDLVDTFIQATILQNNRVREKEAGLIEFFKKIFVNGENDIFRGDTYSYRTNSYNRTVFTHSKEFAEKYLTYFSDEKFMKRFYTETVSSMSNNSWLRERQFGEFLYELFKDFSFESKLKISRDNTYLKPIFKDLNDMFDTFIVGKEYDKAEMLLDHFIHWYQRDNNLSTFYERLHGSYSMSYILENFSDKMMSFISNYKILNYNTRNQLYYDGDLILNELCRTNSIFLRNPDLLANMSFFPKETMMYLGYNFKELSRRNHDSGIRSYNDIQHISKLTSKIFLACDQALQSNDITDEAKVKIAENLKKKFYLDEFRDEENVSKITDSVMSLNADEDLKHDNSGWRSGTPTAQCFVNTATLFLNMVSRISNILKDPDLYNEIDEQMQNSLDTIKLICALQ